MGITFECPRHHHTPHEDFLGVWFANPIDGGPPAPPDGTNTARWQRAGDTFETLTLTPSVDCSQVGCWHGFIRNGEIA